MSDWSDVQVEGGASRVAALAAVLDRVGLQLKHTDKATFELHYDGAVFELATLPLSEWDEAANAAELLAAAAGFDAAIKSAAEVTPEESFLKGAPGMYPKLERRRFVEAYDLVVAGTGASRLVFAEFGADLVTCYVRDEGWRMTYVTEAVRIAWDVSPGTIDAAARSHVYAKADLHDDDARVTIGDDYDAARATIIGDRWFHRAEPGGITCAVPGRDHLFVGPEAATEEAVAQAYAEASYPLCPYVLKFNSGSVKRRQP